MSFGIKKQLLLTVFILITSITFLNTIINYYQYSNSQINKLISHTEAIISPFHQILKDELPNDSNQQNLYLQVALQAKGSSHLANLLDTYSSLEGIGFFSVEEKELLLHGNIDEFDLNKKVNHITDEQIHVIVPLKIENKVLSNTLLAFSAKEFEEEKKQILIKGIISFIVFMTLGLLGTWFVGRNIATPIENLAYHIETNGLENIPFLNRKDEIGLLSKKFEIMRNSLEHRNETNKKQREELDELNKNLEIEVEMRTLELQRTNEELEDSNEELQTTIYNLKRTQEKLIESEKMASLGGLVAGVAHEINTPVGIGLTGITHFIDESKSLVKDYRNDQMTEESFNTFLTNTEELSFLIKDNLERTAHLVQSFKQVAVDQTSAEKRDIYLKKYIEEVLFSLNNLIKKTHLDIKVFGDDKLKVNTFPGSISQIITNFIINSINHAYEEKEEGKIDINISQKNDKIVLIYKDDGKGIKEENLPKIFDPFFTTNRTKGGTGLGLNIIYNIVTNTLNGTIECISKENKGVEFLIIFKVDKIEERY